MAAVAPLVCHGHSRPIVNLEYSQATEDGVFLISSSKGTRCTAVDPRGSQVIGHTTPNFRPSQLADTTCLEARSRARYRAPSVR
jgi:hypothetical protein